MGSTIVEALYQYNVDLPNGEKETVSPGDKFKLIKKSNSDWWYVQFGETGASFYLPATYLRELTERTNTIEVTPPPPSTTEHNEVTEESKNQNLLGDVESGVKRRGSGSSFKSGSSSSARFHHEPPIQEVDRNDGLQHGGGGGGGTVVRPSQLNVQRDVHGQKPLMGSPQVF